MSHACTAAGTHLYALTYVAMGLNQGSEIGAGILLYLAHHRVSGGSPGLVVGHEDRAEQPQAAAGVLPCDSRHKILYLLLGRVVRMC